MEASTKDIHLDCEAGRRLGCASFCCRLIVRLRDGDVDPALPNAPETTRRCVDKDPQSGLCIHYCQQTHRCLVWQDRPQDCREFDCNKSELLQVIFRDGFVSLTAAVKAPVLRSWEPRVQVPEVKSEA